MKSFFEANILFFLILILFSIFNVYSIEDKFIITSPKYFGEQNNIYKDIHYISNEYLSFEFCPVIEVSNLKFELLSNDKILDLKIYKNEKTNCFFTNKNFDEIEFSKFNLQISYLQDNKEKKIIRSFVKQQQSKLINYILGKNYNDLSLVDLSYYLIVLNDIENSQSRNSIDVYERLKNLRDNSKKCWPSGACSVSDTSKILRNLKIAGYDLKSRILEDGRNYLEKNILTNDIETDSKTDPILDFSLNIEHNFATNQEINCNLTLDSDEKRDYIFDKDSSSTQLLIQKSAQDNIQFVCSEKLDKIILKIFNENKSILNQKSFSNEDSINYDILKPKKNEFKFELEFDYDFTSNEEILCNLTTDTNSQKSYKFDENDDLFLTNYAADKVDFKCNVVIDEVIFRLYDSFLNKAFEDIKVNVNSYNYAIVDSFSLYACIGVSNSCNFYDSVNSIFVYGSNINKFNLIEEYIDAQIKKDENGKFVNYLNTVLDSGFYLYYKSNSDLIDYLKFKQNNDGSWGSSNQISRILNTAWAVLGMQKYIPNSEYVDDAEKWIYFNEPFNGWGSIETNTLAYIAIKEKIKPYLKIDAKNEIKGDEIFLLENPTIYNIRDLKLTFSPEINKYLSYVESLGDLDGESSLKFNVSLDKNFFGNIYGNLILTGVDGKQNRIEFINMPINIVGDLPFNIVDKIYPISQEFHEIKLEVKNISNSFNIDCSILNPFDNSNINLKFSSNTNNLILKNSKLKEGQFNLSIKCNSGQFEFDKKFPFQVALINSTFFVEKDKIILYSTEDFSLKITNNFTDKQTLNFEIIGNDSKLFSVPEKSKIIAKNDTREIFFSVANVIYLETLNNLTEAQILITGENGYVKKIPIIVNLGGGVVEDSSWPLWVSILIIVIVLTLIAALVLRYRYLHSQEYQKEDEYFQDDEIYFEDF